MPSDPLSTPTRLAWQSQPTMLSKPFASSLLRSAARQYQWRSQLDRCSATLIHGAPALYFMAAAIFGEVWLCRVGSGIFSAGLCYSLYRFLRAGGFSPLPPDAAAMECLDFYQRQLLRRRDAVKNYLHWGVLPTLPGALLGAIGWIMAEPQGWILPTGIFAFFLGFQYVALQHQTQLGMKFQKEIDLLDWSPSPSERDNL